MRLAIAAALAVTLSTPAVAHTSERGHVMLLPTHLYIVGGALAVALSFAVIAFVAAPRSSPATVRDMRFDLPIVFRHGPSVLSLAFLALLIAAGFAGLPDPLSNPLPGVVWALWWVGFTALCAVLGNLWLLFNPWSGILAMLSAPPPLAYPAWLGQWPAVLSFALFAWFELVHPAPQDPRILATVAAAYILFTFAGALLFGKEAWLQSAECFSVFFRMIGSLSPLQWQRGSWRVVAPGSGLLAYPVRDFSALAFILISLSTVSFDGLSRTFAWLGMLGVNPLEFPAVVQFDCGGC